MDYSTIFIYLMVYCKDMPKEKEKGTYFEGSDKKYPDIELPRWMITEEDE